MFHDILPLLIILIVTLVGCNPPESSTKVEQTNQSNQTVNNKTASSLLQRLDGQRFVSTKKYETGLGPNGEVMGD